MGIVAAGSPLLTVREVAALFGVDPKTVWRWANTGKLPSVRTPGGELRFRPEVIASYLNTAGAADPRTEDGQ